MTLKDLFTIKKEPTPPPAPLPTEREFLSYTEWGERKCRESKGSTSVLKVAVNVVCTEQIKRQIEKDGLIKEKIRQLEGEISVNETKIENCDSGIASKKAIQEQYSADIAEKKAKAKDIKQNPKDHNLDESLGSGIERWAGSILLFFLSVYLFIFYSSATYLAFFKEMNLEDLEGKIPAIFDPQALSKAWNESFSEFTMILLLPVVFLSLGFVIENLSQKKSILKIVVLYALTFVFDALLAYEITDKILGIKKAGSLTGATEVTVWEPFQDIRFWIIIFAGFVVYIIWGLLWKAFLALWNNKNRMNVLINALNKEVDELTQKIGDLNQEIQDILKVKEELRTKNSELKSTINQLNLGNTNGVSFVYDAALVRKEMDHFYIGWVRTLRGVFHVADIKPHDEAYDEILINRLGEKYSLKYQYYEQ